MSGHNKWSKIKRKKEASDSAKSKAFAMHAKKIAVEARASGGDSNHPGLKAAIQKARGDNMPNENIERAVARGAGDEAAALEEVRYEAYGPGGAAIIIEGITDNKNRTTQEIKHLFTKRGLEITASGAATWAFEKTADGWVPKQTVPLPEAAGEALDDVIEELEAHEDVKNVYTNAV